MFIFTDDYRLGNPTIDGEHEKLVALLNNAMEQIKKEDTDLSFLAASIKTDLQEYAATHFEHEEALMETTNDPELPKQKKEHAEFIQKVKEFQIDDSLTKDTLEDMMQYWVRWLFHHILHSDMMIGKFNAAAKEEDIFAFTDKYRTGVEMIDDEHAELFNIIREVNDLVHEELLHDKYDEIINILSRLQEYTEKHFADEEAYMQEIGYPRLDSQKRAHAAFIDKLVNLDLKELDFIDDNQQEYLENLVSYLLDWLIQHILMADKQIGTWVAEH